MEKVKIGNGETTWLMEITTWKTAVLSVQTLFAEGASGAYEKFDIAL